MHLTRKPQHFGLKGTGQSLARCLTYLFIAQFSSTLCKVNISLLAHNMRVTTTDTLETNTGSLLSFSFWNLTSKSQYHHPLE